MNSETKKVTILKTVSVDLGDDQVGIVTYVYHTDKQVKSNSFYTYFGWVDTRKNIEARIAEMTKDENALKNWTMDSEISKDWVLWYDRACTNTKGANWMKARLNKILDWDQYVELIKFGRKYTQNGICKESDSSKYDYTAHKVLGEDTTFDLDNIEAMKKLVGKFFHKPIPLKRFS